MAYSLLAETFAEYGIGVSVLLLRLFARIKVVGWRNLNIGDAFAVLAIVSTRVLFGWYLRICIINRLILRFSIHLPMRISTCSVCYFLC